MRNQPRTENSLARFVEEQVSKRLPPGWVFQLGPQPASERAGSDAVFTLRCPDGAPKRLALAFKTNLEPRMLPALVDQVRTSADPLIIGAPFLSPRTRDRLSAANLSYADLTGNLRLVMNEPAIFIEAEGLAKNPWRERRPLMSLKGRAAGRVVRALCDFTPPYTLGELAKKSGASLASASRVVSLLENEAYLAKAGRGRVTHVEWADLIRRWAQDYSVRGSNTVSSYIEPRGLDALKGKLNKQRDDIAVTGSLAARIPTSVAPARLAMIYSRDSVALAAALDLRPTDAGANVLLLEPFDPIVFERASIREGWLCAAFSQVAADLLTSPGRGPEEAEELLRWMQENEDAWRA